MTFVSDQRKYKPNFTYKKNIISMPRKLGNPWHGGFIDGFDNQIFVNTVPIPTLHKWRRGRAEILDEGTVFI